RARPTPASQIKIAPTNDGAIAPTTERTIAPTNDRSIAPPGDARIAATNDVGIAPTTEVAAGDAAIVPIETTSTATAPPLTAPLPPTANRNGSFSLSRQLGLGIAKIVIDAGHGGHDPGAQARGITEAELTLDISLRLEKLLSKEAGFEVVMT